MKSFSFNSQKNFFFLFLFILLFSASSSYGMEEGKEENSYSNKSHVSIKKDEEAEEFSEASSPKMPFKLGFEFQEANNLCPWALNNNKVQKKELFFFKCSSLIDEDKKKLWHVEIDTKDIEFVTKPFSPKEKILLEISIKTILKVLDLLKEFGKEQIAFKEWFTAINKEFSENCEKTQAFESIENALLVLPSQNWKPRFSPQVTIQHPLEHTIPLYFSLFGFKITSETLFFKRSLPLLDLFLEFYNKQNFLKAKEILKKYNDKVNGLIFVHAATLLKMTPEYDEKEDSEFLQDTFEFLRDFNQADAKMCPELMSRRPFSSMLKEIRVENYKDLFHTSMKLNKDFMELYEVPFLFYKANYAEQFFDEETGNPKSLRNLLNFFKEDFVKENEDVLNSLLSQGVVSTAMLRNIKPEYDKKNIVSTINNNKYYQEIINSVENPKKRGVINLEDPIIEEVDYLHDALSPPWFLEENDAMGYFREENDIEEKSYGEALIEVRCIKNVGLYFLEKMELDSSKSGDFLTNITDDTTNEAFKLFDFLFEFGNKEDIMDFMLGLIQLTSTN